jgi:hypothetical protein
MSQPVPTPYMVPLIGSWHGADIISSVPTSTLGFYAASATTSVRYMCGQPGCSTGRIGWASTEPNHHTGRSSDQVGYKCCIVPLDVRDGRPTTLIRMDGHGGPVPQEPAAGVMSRPLHDWIGLGPSMAVTPWKKSCALFQRSLIKTL